ncbi:hypothetical protein [Xanthomonas graminis]|jgi:hypothetical protein|uniref:Putative secreted protein n=1 Tax=Xanthomonas graminis pv. graminis TaxID=134874 RepID=A0A1M4JKN6_9XANT|nr:hypothetical protein [Xanthomonas translucens]EKU24132.1 hypothetical protein XTG29_03061 [Xanthomonas translucens pv. graminis ART-Xtg29]UKE55130.1 hypothetical protein KFS84_04600 [Xanthomonas translucens pv. graminis]WIH09485.1 hypothetical protein KM579_05080 [Xanthomonas translucens pv. graminis]WIH12812.1 hypothetical protein KM563_03070 [Xanthomonas translucens pv. graminis]WIH15396.1 hypothetical protein KM433_16435 [Xanthomonas translucens pv. graminis]
MVPHIAAFAATLAFVAATTRAFAHRGKPLLPPHAPTAALPDAAIAAPATVSQETC